MDLFLDIVVFFFLSFRQVKWTPTTPGCRATEATYWTSSGIPSTTTASPPAPRTPRLVHFQDDSLTFFFFFGMNMSM